MYGFVQNLQIVGVLSDKLYSGKQEEYAHIFHPLKDVFSLVLLGKKLLPAKLSDKDNNIYSLPKSKRAWILFSHCKLEAKEYFVKYFDEIGNRLEEHKSGDTYLYLYDLT